MNTTDFNELKAGEVLQGGTYRIESAIGADGFGITYRARNTRLNLVYDVKEFFIDGYCTRNAGDKTVSLSGMDATKYEKCREKFIEEAQSLTRINHPNVVKVVDVFAENNTAYMVTSCVEGDTLQTIVEQRGKLSYDAAADYIAQLSEAVGCVHEKNILHRDLKPDNVIITSDNRAMLVNFGATREFVHDKIQARASILAQGYAPLEQYTANGRKGTWSDVYSLGAITYFAMTGQKPMDAATRTLENMPEPKTLVPAIPDAANRAILKAMQPKPENRLQTAQEFLKNLQNPENKIQSSVESVKDFASNFVNEKLKTKLELSKLKIDRKYLKIAIPAIIVVCIGLFFLIKPSGATYLAAVELNGKWGFIDKTGKEVIPCIYDSWPHNIAPSFQEGLVIVKLNGKSGFIDKTGKEITSFKYDMRWERFTDGLARVKFNEKYGFIDKTGKEVISCKYDNASSFSEGLAAAQRNNKWGFIDKTGKEVIPCIYDDAFSFSEGLAVVQRNYKWGFIDKTGKEVILRKYNEAGSFSEGFAIVVLNGKISYIDKTGKEIVPYIYDNMRHDLWNETSFSKGFAAVQRNDKRGFIDKTGKEVIPCIYDGVGRGFSEGLLAVKNNDKWGFINKTGKEVIPCIYDDIEGIFSAGIFSEGLLAVKNNDKWGFINKTGKEVIPCIYDDIVGGEKNSYGGNFSEGLVLVELNDKYSFIDKTGKEVISCKYDYAASFSGGFAPVQRNKKWGFIDKTGKEVIPCIYDDVRKFEDVMK